jgi:hypothetical protein
MTSVGDVIVGGTAGAAERLAKGDDKKFLGASATNIGWFTPPITYERAAYASIGYSETEMFIAPFDGRLKLIVGELQSPGENSQYEVQINVENSGSVSLRIESVPLTGNRRYGSVDANLSVGAGARVTMQVIIDGSDMGSYTGVPADDLRLLFMFYPD